WSASMSVRPSITSWCCATACSAAWASGGREAVPAGRGLPADARDGEASAPALRATPVPLYRTHAVRPCLPMSFPANLVRGLRDLSPSPLSVAMVAIVATGAWAFIEIAGEISEGEVAAFDRALLLWFRD